MCRKKLHFKSTSIHFIDDAPKYLRIVLPLFVVVSLGYFIWRFSYTVNWLVWFAIPLFILEFYNFLNTLFFLITTQKVSYPKWQEPLKKKSVDIFIPTYNEPEEIVEMTTIGALAVRGVNKVFVLDDGNRENIKKLAKRLKAEYLARGENSHAKAGNLNYGLKFSDADFIINVDCDHVPQPHFIERLLGYFADEKLAFIQTPQVFYNRDSIQHIDTSVRSLWNEQTMFYESIQPGKNRFNASFFCGSGAMIRRAALDSVGGYATGTATEDIHTSIRLHSKGWKSLFVHELLAYGLAPEDLREYHKQRVRWGAGSLGLLFRSPDSPLWTKGLSLMQRLCYLNSAMAYMEGTLKVFYFTVPLYVIFISHDLLYIDFFGYLAIFIPFLFFSYLVTYFFSRKTYHFPYTELFNIINIFSHLEAIKGIIKIQKKFGVSIKVKTGKQSAIIYPGLWILFSLLLFGNIYGIYQLQTQFGSFNKGTFSTNNYLMIGLFWNSFNLFFVMYALFYLTRFTFKKREAHKFSVNLSAKILPVNIPVQIKRISLNGAVLEINSAVDSKGPLQLYFKINDDTFTIPILIQNYENEGDITKIAVTFEKLTPDQRISLTLYFFHVVVPELFRKDFKFKEDALAVPILPQPALLYAKSS